MRVEWMLEPQFLRTGGSIGHYIYQKEIKNDFIVLNGDTWLGFNMNEIYKKPVPLIGIKYVENISRYGSLTLLDDKIDKFIEKEKILKSGWINVGLYKLSPELFLNGIENLFHLKKKCYHILQTIINFILLKYQVNL